MKKKIKSLWALVAAGGVMLTASCKNYLEVENPSNISQAAVFNSVSYTNSAIIGIYNRLNGDDAYGSRLSIAYPQCTDEFKASGNYSATDRRGISMYGASAANEEMENPFKQLYSGIERANICIKFIPESRPYNSGSASDQKMMRQYYAEALTLRAQFYYELIRNWGDVPAQFAPSADLPELYLPRTDRNVIYDQILEDLKTAEEYIPWWSQSEKSQRLTKAAVKGLRARIALARGGYSLQGGKQGIMARSDDYKKYYQIALEECKSITESKEHGLNPSFENIFKTLHGNRLDPTNELIWEVGAFGGGKSDTKLAYANGIRIHELSSYGRANGGIVAIPTYFYDFDSQYDMRRDVTIVCFEIDKDNNKSLTASTDMRDGKFRKYWTTSRDASQTLGVNWPLIRYADILLMFAEADNEINQGPSAAAIEAFEQVRKRGFAGNEDKIGTTPADYAGFFEAIKSERHLEFGGEGIRKYDLIRWNLLDATIKDTRRKLTAFMNGEEPYTSVPLDIYVKATAFSNLSTIGQEIATFDLYGGSLSVVTHLQTPAAPPQGYIKKAWRSAVTNDYINGDLVGFARYFEANKTELLPISVAVLNQNYNLTQNKGY